MHLQIGMYMLGRKSSTPARKLEQTSWMMQHWGWNLKGYYVQFLGREEENSSYKKQDSGGVFREQKGTWPCK